MLIDSDYRQIPLSQGKFAIVDAADYEWLMQWKWDYCGRYARRRENLGTFNGKQKWKTFLMHRVILETPIGMLTDHINRDKLDNRKVNLRICTAKENTHNRSGLYGKSSKYKGVMWSNQSQKWRAYISHKHLGYFSSEIDAAIAYDEAAKKLHGQFSNLNMAA